jgi:hypothetical protein
VVDATYSSLDNERIGQLLVAAQVCDVDAKVDTAITKALVWYKAGCRVTTVPLPGSGTVGNLTTSVLLCRTVMECFGFSHLQVRPVERIIRRIIWDNPEALGVQTLAEVFFAVGVGYATTGVGIIIGMGFGVLGYFTSIPASARALIMCICDIVLVLERAFWMGRQQIHESDLTNAAYWFKNRRDAVHNEVKDLVPLTRGVIKSFQYSKIKVGIEEIVQRYRYRP